MKTLISAGFALLVAATSAEAGRVPHCYPDNGPAPGELVWKAKMEVSVPKRFCSSGRLVLVGG